MLTWREYRMVTKTHETNPELQEWFDKQSNSLKQLIDMMEGDGDFGPSWASVARNVLQVMEDFLWYDPRDDR